MVHVPFLLTLWIYGKKEQVESDMCVNVIRGRSYILKITLYIILDWIRPSSMDFSISTGTL